MLKKYVNKTNNTIILPSKAVVGSKTVAFFTTFMSSACRPTVSSRFAETRFAETHFAEILFAESSSVVVAVDLWKKSYSVSLFNYICSPKFLLL